ncbi:MAG: nitrilase-related carbon-nitrogen hydrolase [Candidatus Woesearchaeota archaeon]
MLSINNRKIILKNIVLLLGITAYAFVILYYIPIMGLLLFVPLYYYSIKAKNILSAFIFGASFGLLYYATGFYWTQGHGLMVTLLGFILFGLSFGMLSLLSRYSGNKYFKGLFLISLYWLLLCIIMMSTTVGAYMFMYGIFTPAPSILAYYAGLLGVSIIAMLFMYSIGFYLCYYKKQSLYGTIIMMLILLLPVHLFVGVPEPLGIRVSALQDDYDYDWDDRRRDIIGETQRHIDISSQAIGYTDIIVWPEFSVNVDITTEDYSHVRELLLSFAEQNNITIVIGSLLSVGDKHYNTAMMITPEGLQRDYVTSITPIFFTEYTIRGTELSYLHYYHNNGIVRIGVLLCYEEYHTGAKKDYEDINILFMMTDSSDLKWGNNVADRFAAYRAVEYRVPVVRSVNGGTAMIVQPNGKIVAKGNRGDITVITAMI